MHQAGWHRRLILPVPAVNTVRDRFFIFKDNKGGKRDVRKQGTLQDLSGRR